MKIEHIRLQEEPLKHGFCMHFPHGYVRCEAQGVCAMCALADRLRRARPPNIPLFTWRDALPQTQKKGGDNWLNMPVLLTPDGMKRHEIPVSACNQMAVAYDGAGLFARNSHSEIDIYLVCDSTKRYTVGRHECYGIPTESAAKRYDELYLYCVSNMLKKQ